MRHSLLLILLLFAGCSTPLTMQDEPQSTSAPGLTLDVEAEPLVLGRGETLHIQLTVANSSGSTVVRHFSSGCIYGFTLLDSKGERVAPAPRICTANAPTVRYMPGEVVSIDFRWVWEEVGIEPGTYHLIVGLGRNGDVESAPAVAVQLR